MLTCRPTKSYILNYNRSKWKQLKRKKALQ